MDIFLSGIYFPNSLKKCKIILISRKGAHSNGISQLIYRNVIVNNKPQNLIFSLGKDGFFKVWNS